MTDTLFEVVFQGRLVDGFSATDVQANVARLFKATPQQVEQMFSGKRVVIRNQLDQETALKYQVLLRKNGAVSRVEAMKPAATQPALTAAPAPVAPKASPGPLHFVDGDSLATTCERDCGNTLASQGFTSRRSVIIRP